MPPAQLAPAEIARMMQQICADLGDDDLVSAFKALEERLSNPRSFVTVCGETSTGKSSLINGLIGYKLLPATASPTTAAVVQISFEDGADLEFVAINRDGTDRRIGEEEFGRLVTTAPAELLRLRIRIDPASPALHGLEVFDTPGYNSVMAEHEEILRSFLPESDLIVFVTSYKSGFGQVDQDLLDTIRAATVDAPDIPVFLVVNRVPEGKGVEEKRVQEILSNASDCLKQIPELFLVPALPLGEEDKEGVSRIVSRVPDARELWSSVSSVIQNPERTNTVEHKLRLLLSELVEETDSLVLNRILALASDASVREEVEQHLRDLVAVRKDSLELVEKRIESIERMLPRVTDREIEGMGRSLCSDIDRSDKWLGSEDCGSWIVGHAFEFEGRKVGKSIEEYILSELEQLNDDLADLANTAVQRISASVRIRDTTKPDLGKKLAGDILQRIGGHAVRGVLRPLGGACGVSAGAGNLVKMVVSRATGLFGKTLSREVYNSIGRTFTKRLIQKLNVSVLVLIEVISFLHHVKSWQGKLKKEVGGVLGAWRGEVCEDLGENQIPKIRSANLEGVHNIYDSMIRDLESALKSVDPAEESHRLQSIQEQIDSYRKCLAT